MQGAIVLKKRVASVGGHGLAAVREATTGRVLAQVWAVGQPVTAPGAAPALVSPAKLRPQPELAFYRKYTEAMLRRYMRMATESGRVPSMLGRELFRSKVTSYRVQSFDDVVIFCIDVERCVAKLEKEQQELIKRISLQEYTQGETASLLGMSLRDVVRKYGAALDRLTSVFLKAGMLEKLPGSAREA